MVCEGVGARGVCANRRGARTVCAAIAKLGALPFGISSIFEHAVPGLDRAHAEERIALDELASGAHFASLGSFS